jgi:hypothetical protein
VINPLDDTSPWTFLLPCACAQCRPPIAEFLKDVLKDADLTITYRRPGVDTPSTPYTVDSVLTLRAKNGIGQRIEPVIHDGTNEKL